MNLSESDGLLSCRQCSIRYAWASDHLDLRAAAKRVIEAYMSGDDMANAILELELSAGLKQQGAS